MNTNINEYLRNLCNDLINKLQQAEEQNEKLRQRIEILEISADSDYCLIETLKSQNEKYEIIINKIQDEISANDIIDLY